MKNKKKLTIIITAILVLLAIIITSLLLLFKNNKETLAPNEIKSEPETKEIIKTEEVEINIEMSEDIDLSKMRKQYGNNQIVGRLEIPGLFNIIIVQAKDNTYYLDHSINKKKDVKGTEFMDYRNTTLDKQINIYGHNSRTYDIPFRKLENFKKNDFFNQHQYIIYQTDQAKRIYQILAIKEISGVFEHMKINKEGKEFVEHVDLLKRNAIQKRDLKYDENSNLLVLQTCSYGKKKTYYVITAIEIKNYTY